VSEDVDTVRSFVSVLAHASRSNDLLPALHEHALEVTGGSCAILFQHNPRNGMLHATSGYGLDALRAEAWTPDESESSLVDGTFETRSALLVAEADRLTPDLAARLDAAAAVLIPLIRDGERVGLLAIGFRSAPPLEMAEVEPVADAYVAALELTHLRQREQLQRDVIALLDGFSTSLTSTLSLATSLSDLCQGANRLFAADRTSAWIYERRKRNLVLQAASDPRHVAGSVRVDADDDLAPAAVAMRRERAEIVSTDAGGAIATLTIPLRGRRRALGTIVIEGVRIEGVGEIDVLDRGRRTRPAAVDGDREHAAARRRGLLEARARKLRSIRSCIWSRRRSATADRLRQPGLCRARWAHAESSSLAEKSPTPVGPELAAWLERQQNNPHRAVAEDGERAGTREIVDPVLNGPFLVTCTELLDHDRRTTGSVIVARDQLVQSKLEGEREEHRKRLTQTEKLAALGQFIAGIAHD
jgi:hypothetical protein